MGIEIYGYVPAKEWNDLPDISPYVTKVIFYMKMVGVPYSYHSQDLAKLDADAPFGKLPYIIDTDDNTKVADSNAIIDYLKKKFGNKLDSDLSKVDQAVCLGFERLLGEHLYWSGIIEPRWRSDQGWETYIPYIVQGAEVGPELRGALDAFRGRILDGFKGHGMGRRDSPTVLECYKTDVDALSDFMSDKTYFYGDRPHAIDAALYSLLRHLVEQPQKWKGTGYVEGKKNLRDYMDRMRKEFQM